MQKYITASAGCGNSEISSWGARLETTEALNLSQKKEREEAEVGQNPVLGRLRETYRIEAGCFSVEHRQLFIPSGGKQGDPCVRLGTAARFCAKRYSSGRVERG
jgi:hypothetical protein